MPGAPLSEATHPGVHTIMDAGIGLAYLVISLTLLVFWRRAGRELPKHWVFPAFALFMVSCGAGHVVHLVDILDVSPAAAEMGHHVVDAFTLVSSVATAMALPPLVPHLVRVVRGSRRARLEAERKAKMAGVVLAARTLEHEVNNRLALTAGVLELALQGDALAPSLRTLAEDGRRSALEAAALVARMQGLAELPERDWGAGVAPTIQLVPAPASQAS